MGYDQVMARRRRRWGQGTVYPRADGRWAAALPDPATGRKTYRYGPTRAAARALLDELLAGRDAGVSLPPAGLTVGDFLRRWLDDVAAPSIRESTLEGYRHMIGARMVPSALGRLPLARATTLDVQRYLNELTALGRSPFTVRHHLGVLRQAFGHAVEAKMLPSNPAAAAKLRKLPRPDRPTLDPAATIRFLDWSAGTDDEALYALALTTGMRQSELLGLAWDDVDLDEALLTVRGQLDGDKNRGWTIVPTKTDEVHAIALCQRAVDALRSHRARQLERRLRAGGDWPFWGLVFVGPRGLPLSGSTVTTRFKRHLVAAGLPLVVGGKRFHFHDLRHSTATLLLGEDVDAKIIADLLGHTTTRMTTDTYQHVSVALTRVAAAAMQRVVGGAS